MQSHRFAYEDSHPNYQGHRWLDQLIEDSPTPDSAGRCKPQVERASKVDKKTQISVLRACVERMPWYREHGLKPEGTICYEVACYLYNQKLPLLESDICDLLSMSQHLYGHGGDVVEPFEFMVAYARNNGTTPKLLRATRTYLDKLTGDTSIQAQHIKTSGRLVLLLDSEAEEQANQCWSEQFRIGLRQVPTPERRHWELIVLDIKPTMISELPNGTKKKLLKSVKGIVGDLVVKRLSDWIPNPEQKAVFAIDTGGSHLLKHFVWLIEAVAEDNPKLLSEADSLVCRLCELDWKPRDKAQKVMVTAAHYLAKRPPEVSWNALQKIESWCRSVPKNDYTGSKLDALIRDYQQKHGCSSNS